LQSAFHTVQKVVEKIIFSMHFLFSFLCFSIIIILIFICKINLMPFTARHQINKGGHIFREEKSFITNKGCGVAQTPTKSKNKFTVIVRAES
jgi:hypothetical protein